MPAKEASFVDTASDSIARFPPLRAKRILVLLFFLGLMSFAAVQSYRLNYRECGSFTIGQSAIGGCDWIAR